MEFPYPGCGLEDGGPVLGAGLAVCVPVAFFGAIVKLMKGTMANLDLLS